MTSEWAHDMVWTAGGRLAHDLCGSRWMVWGTLFDDLETVAVAGGDLFSQIFMAQAAAQQATGVPPEQEVCPHCGEPLSGDDID